MPMFRKKPVVIEAVQWSPDADGVQQNAWPANWPVGEWEVSPAVDHPDDPTLYLIIPTLEGNHGASPGDWIIKGVKGEFYPCKPDIFAATYEPATTQGAQGDER